MKRVLPLDTYGDVTVARRCRIVQVLWPDAPPDDPPALLTVNGKPYNLGDDLPPGATLHMQLTRPAPILMAPSILVEEE